MKMETNAPSRDFEARDWFHHVHAIVDQIDSAVTQMKDKREEEAPSAASNFYQQQYQRYLLQQAAKPPSGGRVNAAHKHRKRVNGIAVGELMTFAPVEYRWVIFIRVQKMLINDVLHSLLVLLRNILLWKCQLYRSTDFMCKKK